MKSKLISVTLIAALLLTSAVCSYASNGNSKIHSGKDAAVTATEDQKSMKEKINQKREHVRSEYTEQEIKTVKAAAEQIKEEDPTAKVLDVDSIISDNAEFKFDTPPVIKGGRTLIPVRAITEGFGAQLAYDKESQLVTITKGDTVIELTLGSMTAVVNGQEVQMDTKANLENNRTYVPLRFVLETFRMSVNWDKDTETIEISDGTTDGTTGDTTAGDTTVTDGQTGSTTGDAITVSE